MNPPAFLATIFTALRGLLPLVVVLALLVSGCGTTKLYEGPELTKSEISVIDFSHSHGWTVAFFGVLPIPLSFRHGTIVLEVDGQQGRGRGPYHVLPGQHTAKVAYTDHHPVNLCSELGCIFNYKASLTINFTTEAGHEYRIPAERVDERNWIWVEDVTTGKVVSGEKPPDDKGEEKEKAADDKTEEKPPATPTERP